MNQRTTVIFSYAFRPFFLLSALFSILAITAWVMTLRGAGFASFTQWWHGHEMLVGFALAAVAGFSLTAVANWTGRPALKDAALAWLVICWLAGRFAMALAGVLTPTLVALLDMLFPVLLCILLAGEIFGGRSTRNYPLVAIMVTFIALNGLYHLGTNQLVAGGDRLAVYLLIHTILALVVIIAGRIVPVFTGNWLRAQGQTRLPVSSNGVDRAALSLTVLVGLAVSFFPQHAVTGVLALLAALVHTIRLSRWRGFATTTNPLLFVLHVAYAWLPVGYALLVCSVFGWFLSPTAALHALTMGAIGGMVLAVITRVSLGHTGRGLKAARLTVFAYWLFMLAVLIRVLGALPGKGYLLMIELSALGWVLAFLIFLWVYWPILTTQRTQKQ